jgi:hypothetical protein
MKPGANQWFRLYSDMPDSIKLRSVSERAQISFVWIMCLHCRGDLAGIPIPKLAWSLRVDSARLSEDVAELQAGGLLDSDMIPTGWDHHQYESDNSAERMRKLRKKRHGDNHVTAGGDVTVTANVRPCDGDVTAGVQKSDVLEQSRTEQNRAEQNNPPVGPPPTAFAASQPMELPGSEDSRGVFFLVKEILEKGTGTEWLPGKLRVQFDQLMNWSAGIGLSSADLASRLEWVRDNWRKRIASARDIEFAWPKIIGAMDGATVSPEDADAARRAQEIVNQFHNGRG